MSVRTIELVFGDMGLRCNKGENISLRKGENEATTIAINVSRVVNKWSDALFNINATIITSTATNTYEVKVNLAPDTNGYIYWDVNGSLLTAAGLLKIEVFAVKGEKVAISGEYSKEIVDSSVPTGSTPPSTPSWILELLNAAIEVGENTELVELDRIAVAEDKSDIDTLKLAIDQIKTDTLVAKTAAESASTDAVSAKTSAQGYASSALSDRQLAQQAATDSGAAKNLAVSAKDSASGYATSALGYKNAAEQAAIGLDAARDEAVTAKIDAVAAKETAQAAKDTAVSAQGEAINVANSLRGYLDKFDNGEVGIGVETPTSALHIKASTSSAGGSSLKIDPGTLLSIPESGAIEFDGTNLYFTNSSGIRKTIAVVS